MDNAIVDYNQAQFLLGISTPKRTEFSKKRILSVKLTKVLLLFSLQYA